MRALFLIFLVFCCLVFQLFSLSSESPSPDCIPLVRKKINRLQRLTRTQTALMQRHLRDAARLRLDDVGHSRYLYRKAEHLRYHIGRNEEKVRRMDRALRNLRIHTSKENSNHSQSRQTPQNHPEKEPGVP